MTICSVSRCEKKADVYGLCKMHDYRLKTHGDFDTFIGRRKKVDYEINENGCFICTSHAPNKKGKKGYPLVRAYNTRIKVCKLVYIEMFGEIPKGFVIRHKCDQPMCINPEHLELGTQRENVLDIYARGRQNNVRGEKHGKSKLNEKDVMEIKKLLNQGELSQENIAKRFNVSASCIQEIKSKRTWSHVNCG